MSPEAATALHVLAYGQLHNAQPEKAVALLEALDALRPDDTRTLLALATAHLRSGAAARALQALTRVAQSANAPAATDLLRAQALGMLGRHAEAKAVMHAFLARRPERSADANLPK